MKKLILLFILIAFWGCDSKGPINSPVDDPPDEPDLPEKIYRVPVVVHIVHLGEPIGEGHNLSVRRIEDQIRVLNEDFRRKKGTRGYNDHPDGGDTRIEFFLAQKDPAGNESNGIVRINATEFGEKVQFASITYYASLSYWNPEHYLNIWTEPMPDDFTDLVLGHATGPITDLPGADRFTSGEPENPEGIMINSAHFGITDSGSDYNLGRTLTHEIGHYLGLLHTWGTGECETNDYCDDTPPVENHTATIACDGQPVMRSNYMTYSPDRLLNIFTNDQIARMHYVLENSPYRKTLLESPGLPKSDNNTIPIP